MQGCRLLGTPGYGKELSLVQPEESLLDEEAKRRSQAVVGSAMYRGQVTQQYGTYHATNTPPASIYFGT